MNREQKLAYSTLTAALQELQDTSSYKTGFGYGFPCFVRSVAMADKMQITYAHARRLYRELSDMNLVRFANNRYRQHIMISTVGWDGCEPVNDYFIEKED